MGALQKGSCWRRKITEKYQGSVEIITSFAGITKKRRAVVGRSRVGGFGGVQGLADYLQDAGISYVVDATHPFAAQIKRNASEAVKRAGGVALVHILRPEWQAQAGDAWLMGLMGIWGRPPIA